MWRLGLALWRKVERIAVFDIRVVVPVMRRGPAVVGVFAYHSPADARCGAAPVSVRSAVSAAADPAGVERRRSGTGAGERESVGESAAVAAVEADVAIAVGVATVTADCERAW